MSIKYKFLNREGLYLVSFATVNSAVRLITVEEKDYWKLISFERVLKKVRAKRAHQQGDIGD